MSRLYVLEGIWLKTCCWSKIKYCCAVFQVNVVLEQGKRFLHSFFFFFLIKDERDTTCFCLWTFEMLEVFWGDGLAGKVHVVELLFRTKSSFRWVWAFWYLLFIWSYVHFCDLKKGLSCNRPVMKNFDNSRKASWCWWLQIKFLDIQVSKCSIWWSSSIWYLHASEYSYERMSVFWGVQGHCCLFSALPFPNQMFLFIYLEFSFCFFKCTTMLSL